MVIDRPKVKSKTARLWELDAWRGAAIVLMVFYHFMWDLNFFGVYQGNMLSAPWQTFARSIASMFMFAMGVSMTLSYRREIARFGSAKLFPKYLLRGGKIFGWGMVITVVTYFAVGRGWVVFGILHSLGLSMILAYPFLGRSPRLSLAAGLIVIALGVYVNGVIISAPWLIWLGVKQYGRSMVDFYPVLPYFGVVLLGVYAGYTLYPQQTFRFPLPDYSQKPPVRGLNFLGRHSLVIYLIHQPIILGTLILLGVGSLF